MFEDACLEYMTRAKVHLDSFLTMGEPPTTDEGFAGQIIGYNGGRLLILACLLLILIDIYNLQLILLSP